MARDDISKLEILLDHWIEHNREHADEFTQWAEKAKGAGQVAVHDDIKTAAEEMTKANEALLAALKRLKER